MKNKYLTLPIKKFEIEDIDDDLVKVKIYVMHDGKNLNKSNFSKEAIENAKDTIQNKPLIGVIEKDKFNNKDFGGHEIEYKIIRIDDGIDIETIYIEQPLGLIPETNNYHYETIDDKEWVVIDGYIWKEYCKEAYEILESSDKTVSMEIKILESHNDDDDEFWIDKFAYTGITLLGDSHQPAMGSDATVSLYEVSNKKDFITSFDKISSEINKYIINIKEDKNMLKNKNKNKFSMSVSQMENLIREQLKKKTYIHENYWGESRESQKYYLWDLVIEEKICIVVDNESWDIYYGIPYSFDGDIVTLDYDNMQRYIIGDWRPMTDGQTNKSSSKVFEVIKTEYNKQFEEFEEKVANKTKQEFDIKKTEEYTTLKKELDDLQEKYSSNKENITINNEKIKNDKAKQNYEDLEKKNKLLQKENKRLKDFETGKLADERKEKEGKLFADYPELKEVEEFETLKNESEKYSLEELDIKLAVLYAKTMKNKKKSFSTDNKNENTKINVDLDEKVDTPDLYGGLFEKYGVENK